MNVEMFFFYCIEKEKSDESFLLFFCFICDASARRNIHLLFCSFLFFPFVCKRKVRLHSLGEYVYFPELGYLLFISK